MRAISSSPRLSAYPQPSTFSPRREASGLRRAGSRLVTKICVSDRSSSLGGLRRSFVTDTLLPMIRIEISLRLPNTPGALAGVTRLLSDEHVNVLAMSLGTGGELRLL